MRGRVAVQREGRGVPARNAGLYRATWGDAPVTVVDHVVFEERVHAVVLIGGKVRAVDISDLRSPADDVLMEQIDG